MNRRLFAAICGRHLIYNTCWEDPELDRVALDFQPDDRVLVITSAGCNALDYLLAGVSEVHAVDINPCQNAVLALKIAGIRNLNYESFYELFGRGRSGHARAMYHDVLREALPGFARRFWDRHLHYFRGKGWRNSFYYRGTFGFIARCQLANVREVLGLRRTIERLLAATTLEEQKAIYEREASPRIWNPLTNFICSRRALLSLIGIPWEQQKLIQEYPGGVLQLSRDIVEAVFTRLPLKSNYFWRVYLQGHYEPECCPEYLRRENFHHLRTDLLTRLSIRNQSVSDFLRSSELMFSKFVLLDHMDWLNANNRQGLVDEWNAILARAGPGARVIFRSAGLKVTYLDDLPVMYQGQQVPLGSLLRFEPELANELHERDRVHMCGSFHIARLP